MNYEKITKTGNTQGSGRKGKKVAFCCSRQIYPDQGHGLASLGLYSINFA